MQATSNYGFRKPEGTDTVNIDDLNYNADQFDTALTPTADLAQVPTSNGPGKLVQWVSWIANRIKVITGKTNWWEAPDVNLATLVVHKSRHAIGGIDQLTPMDIGATSEADFTTHLAETMQQGVHGIATTADITLYVRTDGSDSNDGSANDSAHALRNIQTAINRLPKILNHNVIIRIAPGDYTSEGVLYVRGFIGPGVLLIAGFDGTSYVSTNIDADNYEISRIAVLGCKNYYVAVQGLEAKLINTGLDFSSGGFQAENSSAVYFYYCRDVVNNPERSGFYFSGVSSGHCEGCIASNKSRALRATLLCGIIGSYYWTAGSGNNTGLNAAYGSTIVKWDAEQPQGNQPEIVSTGGIIRGNQVPACSAYTTVDQSIPDVTWTNINLNAEYFDTDDIHSDTANPTRLICKHSGIYVVSARVEFFAALVDANFSGVIAINGNSSATQAAMALSAYHSGRLSLANIVNLAVGDFIELQVYQNTGSSLNIHGGGFTSLSMVKVG